MDKITERFMMSRNNKIVNITLTHPAGRISQQRVSFFLLLYIRTGKR